jgi:ribonuclease E
MTLEEQDIYALMGISPLVLSTDTVKDPKNTIISIALPGQENRLGSVDEPIAVEEPGEAIEAASEAAPDSVDDEVMDTPEPVSKPSAIADTLVLRNTPEAESEAENDSDDSSEASDSASSNRRRRRRRSSASSSRRS